MQQDRLVWSRVLQGRDEEFHPHLLEFFVQLLGG
jgi:hypothetical protein